jgi:hypothetical protein
MRPVKGELIAALLEVHPGIVATEYGRGLSIAVPRTFQRRVEDVCRARGLRVMRTIDPGAGENLNVEVFGFSRTRRAEGEAPAPRGRRAMFREKAVRRELKVTAETDAAAKAAAAALNVSVVDAYEMAMRMFWPAPAPGVAARSVYLAAAAQLLAQLSGDELADLYGELVAKFPAGYARAQACQARPAGGVA